MKSGGAALVDGGGGFGTAALRCRRHRCLHLPRRAPPTCSPCARREAAARRGVGGPVAHADRENRECGGDGKDQRRQRKMMEGRAELRAFRAISYQLLWGEEKEEEEEGKKDEVGGGKR